MPKDNETTTKFKVDISELKKAMQDARKEVALANSEFKATSSGMDDWSKSTDGISAKLKQLDSSLKSQKTVLSEYEKTLEKVKAEYGENSKEAMEYQIKLNNQRAVVNKLEKENKKWSDSLIELVNQERQVATATESLNSTINEQKEELSDLKKKYSDVILEQGKNSEAAKDLAKQIKDLSGELNNNNRKLEETENAADSLDESLRETATSGFTVLKGALADLVADGIRVTIDALKELSTDSSEAYAQFSAATGIAVDAMGEYEDAIKSVYKNNFGESLEDVANKMAKVKEVTKELDASKLQDMTEKAITLEDVFGMDMTETLRGVQSLVTHFGMSAEEAFDYLASGAQNGLNYTDELGDNISEYAGKFAEAGYTAEEYFQLLQNGSEGGAYNLDKINDAINEVTARLADGTIEDGIGGFSKSTQELFSAWQKGEATQKQVIDSITADIRNTTGEQEKMNLAALAFGTMAEDGGTMFIQSLSAVGSTYDNVTGKAQELANIKYDTPAAALSGLGRTLKSEILQPIVDVIAPVVTDFISWCIEHIDTLLPIVTGLATAFGVLAGALAIQGVITGVTKAIALLNATILANPIVLAVAALVGLLAALVIFWNKSEAFRNFWIKLWENVKTVVATGVEAIVNFFTVTIPNAFNSVINWIKANWSTLLTFLINPFAGLFKYFYQNNGKFREFVDNAVAAIREMPGKIWTWLVATITKITEWRNNLIEKGKAAALGLTNAVVNGLKSLPGKIRSIGSDIVRGLWNGINDMTGWVIGKIQGFGDSVLGGLKDFFQIGSPSRLMAKEVGKWLPAGIGVGIEANADSALKSMKNLSAELVGTARNGLSSSTSGINGSSAVGGVVNNFTQINNSPKPLSRLEIYRQSKNLLGYAGGV